MAVEVAAAGDRLTHRTEEPHCAEKAAATTRHTATRPGTEDKRRNNNQEDNLL